MQYGPQRPLQGPPPQGVQEPPPDGFQRPRARHYWRFRWAWLGVPLACIAFAYVAIAIAGPTFDWFDVMDLIGLAPRNFGAYTRLAVLAVALLGAVILYRFMRRPRR